MEAHRATDNIQQKASDCLGTENEKPYTMGDRIKDMNETFIWEAFTMIEALQKLSKKLDANAPKFESGGIVKKPKEGIFLNGSYAHNPWNCRCIIIPKDDNPKKD